MLLVRMITNVQQGFTWNGRQMELVHYMKLIKRSSSWNILNKKLLPNWSLTMRLVNAEKQVFAVIIYYIILYIISSFVRIFVIKLQHRSRETLTCNVCQPTNSIWRDFCVFLRIQSWRKSIAFSTGVQDDAGVTFWLFSASYGDWS